MQGGGSLAPGSVRELSSKDGGRERRAGHTTQCILQRPAHDASWRSSGDFHKSLLRKTTKWRLVFHHRRKNKPTLTDPGSHESLKT